MATLSIREIISKINEGNIRIPSFQRDFVWEPDEIAYFMDSIYKGFPFGTIQLWRTKYPLRIEKKFGPFELFNRDPGYPIDYVIDGQQRLTSIFGVFQTDIAPKNNELNPFKIYYTFQNVNISLNSCLFTPLDTDDYNKEKYFPLNIIFSTKEYRDATRFLPIEKVEEIDQLQSIFKETKIPVQTLETDDKSKVAIVFERINRKGQDLDNFQLLTAWTWSDDFELKEKFENLKEVIEPYGFGNVGSDINLLMRIIAAVFTNYADSEKLLDIDSSIIRKDFDKIENGIRGAIDFLRSELKIESIKNLPFDNILIPLSVFFSIKGEKEFKYTDFQRKSLVKWFWRVCFNKRYSAGTISAVNEDIIGILKIKDENNKLVELLSCKIDPLFFIKNKFLMSSVNTKTYILLLIQNGPASFISGKAITNSEVLKKYNRNEFHHVYPKNFIKSIEKSPYEENLLANFAVISRSDNNLIKDQKPSEYIRMIPSPQNDILQKSFCVQEEFNDDYKNFIENRNKRLIKFANELIS